MSGTGDCVYRADAIEALYKDAEAHPEHTFWTTQHEALRNIPAADVRPVVLCGVCKLHGHCYTEDVFAFARLAEGNRFCAVGKAKTNGEGRMEES